MGVVQPLDEMGVPGTAAARTDGKASRELSLRGGREGSCLLVAHVNPVDAGRPSDRIHEWVEAVADDAVDARHAGLPKDVDELFTDGAHDGLL